MEDDFTFPTVAARAPEGRHDVDGAAALPAVHLGELPLPDFAAPGAQPLWPFAAPPIGTAATVRGQEAPAASRRGQAEEGERLAADEERMDLLWEGTAATALASTASGGHVELPEHRAEAEEDERAAAAAHAERMDLLWESFNEELLLHRARSKAAAADHPGGVGRPGLDQDWYLCYSPSDTESEETSSSPGRERYGCAPMMLRASSRAGGAGQFYGSPRRRPAAGWALLLRLFRRLFAVDKAASRRHGGIYVP